MVSTYENSVSNFLTSGSVNGFKSITLRLESSSEDLTDIYPTYFD